MYAVLAPRYIGVCTTIKEKESKTIKIKILDQLPNLSGPVDDVDEALPISVTTPSGIINHSINVSDIIEAVYLNRNSNQITAPDIQPGERVMVWQEGDSTSYYWEVFDIDNHLRQTEHIIIAFSNTNASDLKTKKLNLANCYYIEYSTRDKRMRMRTNKNDGEPFAYDLLLDTKLGNFRIVDDASRAALGGSDKLAEGKGGDTAREVVPEVPDGVLRGNLMLLDSANTTIELYNVDHTSYVLNGRDLHESCLGDRVLTVGGNNTELITGDETITIDGGRTSKIAKDRAIDIGGDSKSSIGGGSTTSIGGASDNTVGGDVSDNFGAGWNTTVSAAWNAKLGNMVVDVPLAMYTTNVQVGVQLVTNLFVATLGSITTLSSALMTTGVISAKVVSSGTNSH